MQWRYPERRERDDGRMRHVGFELEFAGTDLEELGQEIVRLFGGELTQDSRFSYRIVSTDFGDFVLEVDSIQLKDRMYEDFLEKIGFQLSSETRERIDDVLFSLASVAVPFEIVTPPIPMDRMHELTGLEQVLRKLQARGTRASLLYGFGMQFNPEIPATDPATMLAYMRSFLLLLDWLKQAIDVDLTRRIGPYIDDFPPAYVEKVLDPSYAPGLEGLMDDYLSDNPTRNRPLDMTCLFAHLDEERTLEAIEEPQLVKPRPTFHYRLPDCRIDEAGWSMALEWNRWVEVERLAADATAIEALSRAYLSGPGDPARWVEHLKDEFLHA